MPPLSNTLISLVKDTSLASVVLVTELLRVAQIAAAPTFQFFALYGLAALYYWVICLVLSFVQSRLETRAGKACGPMTEEPTNADLTETGESLLSAIGLHKRFDELEVLQRHRPRGRGRDPWPC